MSLVNQNDLQTNHQLMVSDKGKRLHFEYKRPRPLKDGDAFGERFNCIFCKHLLRQPYQSTCGHRACQECLRRLQNKIKENGRTPARCPECKDPMCLDQFFPDRAATRELKLLGVSCLSRGCSWEGKYLDYFDSHQGACPHARVKCPFDPCNELVLMSDVDEHMKICSYRQVECKYCGHGCHANQMDEHCKSCDQFPVQCPEGCGEEVPRELLKAHIREDCVSHHRACRYQPLGCKFEGCGKDMLIHEEKYTHFHLRMVLKRILSSNAHNHSHCLASLAHHIDTSIDHLDQRILQISSQLASLSTEQQKLSAAKQSRALVVGKLQRLVKELQEYFRDMVRDIRTFQAASYGPVCRMPDLARPSLDTSDPMAIQTLSSRVEVVEDSFEKQQSVLQEQEKRGNAADRAINLLNTSSSEQNVLIGRLQDRLQTVEDTCYGPVCIWKITEVPRCRRDARRDPHHCLEIPAPFYTSRHGYKLCLRVYLNGDGSGRSSHLSLFMTVMRGDYDALLPWPFRQATTLSLMAQDRALEDITQSFKPDESSTSFHRPQTEMNVTSGCPQFCPLSVLDNPGYVQKDVLFIKCEISTKGLDSWV